MLLAHEFVSYISRQIVKKLSPQWIETTDQGVASGFIGDVMEDDLAVEDRLNDEVREILIQHQDEMRRTGVSYQEMYKKVKGQLARDRKLVLR